MLNEKGQNSTIEYLLVFAAVVAVMVIFLKPGSFFQGAIDKAIEINVNSMEEASNAIFN